MRESILLIILGLLLNSCVDNKKPEYVSTEPNQNLNVVITNNGAEILVQKILDLPRLQWIFHAESGEPIVVEVLETAQIEMDFDLFKFGQKVRIISQEDFIKQTTGDIIVFRNLDLNADTVEFELYYETQGVGSAGKFIRDKGEWLNLEYDVWEN